MKELKENLTVIETYKSADTRNKENFRAWRLSDELRLEQLAMTGTLGSSFYASAKEVTEDAIDLLDRADADKLAKAIVHGRQEGFIRTFPILGLLYLSRKNATLFQKVFDQVILTGNDLADFIDLTRKCRGFGRSIKRAISNWLQTKTTPYYAMKYRRALADAIRISRFRGEDPIFAYILNSYGDVKGVNEEKLESAQQKYPELEANRRFIDLLNADKKHEAAELLLESRLDVDHLTAYYDRFDREVWTATANRTPVMRLLKYLAKFAREGVELEPIVEQKITVDNLRKAKVFPFRLYTAYRAYLDAKPKKKPAFPGSSVADRLVQVLDDYSEKYDWSDFAKYSWVIAPDMSGSMTCPLGGSILRFADVSAMFTAFFNRAPIKVRILPWDTKVLPYQNPRSDSVITQMKTITHAVGGGTYMEAPVLEMMSQKIMADYSVFITDTEEYGSGWLDAWKKYRKLNPKAQAFIIRLDSYNTAPISEADAKRYGVWQVFGWNDNVIEYMKYILQTQAPLG